MNNLTGGFLAFRAITTYEREMFNKLAEEVDGVGYEPLAVATQVVSGINYAFFCRAILVGKTEDNAYNSLVVINKPAQEKDPSLVDISKAKVVKPE